MHTPFSNLAHDVQDRLQLEVPPVGFRYSEAAPPGARVVGGGCIAPLVRAAGRGITYVLTPESGGWPCARFYLGFTDWIFDGVEYFLSNGSVPGRECERFIRTPEQARAFVEHSRGSAPAGSVGVLGPLGSFSESEPPDIVILLADPDQMGALVYLAHFDAPTEEGRVVTSFASACASMITLPYRDAQAGVGRARWGFHDPAARTRTPKHLGSLAMPLGFLEEIWQYAPESCLETGIWRGLLARRDTDDGSGRSRATNGTENV